MTIWIDKRRDHQRGISLVEILIVLTIIAMVAGIVVMNMPPGRSDLSDVGDRFAARLDFAAQGAITNGALTGMTFSEDGYAFYLYNRGVWSPLEEKNISGEGFAPDYTVTIELSEAAKKNERADPPKDAEKIIRPEIMFYPTGETTAFSVSFQDRRERVRVTLDNAGHVEVTRDEAAQ